MKDNEVEKAMGHRQHFKIFFFLHEDEQMRADRAIVGKGCGNHKRFCLV